jgi:nitrogen regulatory protein PII 2
MKEVIAVVRINMMNQTKKALTDAGIAAFFAHECQGRGKGFVNPKILAGVDKGYEEAASVLGEAHGDSGG